MDSSHKVSRRIFLKVTGLAGAGVALGGLGRLAEAGAAEVAAPQKYGVPSVLKAPLSVRVRTFLDPKGPTPREKAFVWLVDSFQKANPDIKIEVETIPYDQLNAKLIIENEAGTAPEVSYVQPQGVGKLAASNSVLALDPLIAQWPQAKRDEFYSKGMWDSTVVDGKKLTMAIGIHTRLLYTNKTILKAAGYTADQIPATLEEVVAMGKKATGGKVYGLGMAFGKERSTAEIFYYPILWGFGGEILDAAGKPTFNSEAGIKAMDWIKDLVLTHKITPESSLSIKYADLGTQFPQGMYGMALEGSYRLSGWLSSGMSVDTMGSAAWPSITAGKPSPMFTNSWDLAMPAKIAADKKEAAWKFIAYFFEPEISKKYLLAEGSLPTLKSLLNEPEFKTPYHETFTYVISNGAHGLPITPWTAELSDIMVNAIQSVMLNKVSSKEALDAAAAEYTKLASG